MNEQKELGEKRLDDSRTVQRANVNNVEKSKKTKKDSILIGCETIDFLQIAEGLNKKYGI